MSDENTGIFDMTVPTPMLFPALVEAKPYMENGKPKGDPKFGGTFVFASDHPDLTAAKVRAAEAARAKWPGVDLKTVNWPFSSGSEYATERKAKGKDGTYFEGKAILKARSKYEPMVSWIADGNLHEIPSTTSGHAANKFFSGAEVLATFNFVAVEVDKKRYVTAYLNKVFSTGKGTRVGGGRSAAEAFKGYIGQATTEDPTAGDVGDDDIPF